MIRSVVVKLVAMWSMAITWVWLWHDKISGSELGGNAIDFPHHWQQKLCQVIGSDEIMSCNPNGNSIIENKFSGKMVFKDQNSLRMDWLVGKAVVGQAMAIEWWTSTAMKQRLWDLLVWISIEHTDGYPPSIQRRSQSIGTKKKDQR